MGDTSVQKVQSRYSPHGRMGQKYLAKGVNIEMRIWENLEPGEPKPSQARDYETAGYVISGRAELQIEGQTLLLEPGDSYVVSKGSMHTFRVLEPFTAVEATTPPASAHARDE
jgi:quercetin dioxygenase-like cupin family protein